MTYQGIIERVRAATGADRELDALIMRRLAGNPDAHWYDYQGALYADHTVPEITGSTDFALALAERELPGCKVLMGMRQAPDTLPWARVGEWSAPDATAPTLPIAITLATLLALQSQEPK